MVQRKESDREEVNVVVVDTSNVIYSGTSYNKLP